ncbi:hypothetical protein CSUI_002922 [Cystoisospora suis]|uniref:Transmembrane protein n=1 Tax=Cystoisospora suis TaxID=483139 RepID=A0A2C6L741_9APIC|nr:hypothetical protein CSUI_002922 [Cystoisospora suis]
MCTLFIYVGNRVSSMMYLHSFLVVALLWGDIPSVRDRGGLRVHAAARAVSSRGARPGVRLPQPPYQEEFLDGIATGQSMLQEHVDRDGPTARRLSGARPKTSVSRLARSLGRLRTWGRHGGGAQEFDAASPAVPGPSVRGAPSGGALVHFFAPMPGEGFSGGSGSDMCPRCTAREKILRDLRAAEAGNNLMRHELQLRLYGGQQATPYASAPFLARSGASHDRRIEQIELRASLRDRLSRENERREVLVQRRHDFDNYAAIREGFAASNLESRQEELRREQQARSHRARFLLQAMRQEVMQNGAGPPPVQAPRSSRGRGLFRRSSHDVQQAQAAPPPSQAAQAAIAIVADTTSRRNRRPG